MFIKVIVGLLIYLGVGAVMGDNIVFGLLCFGVALWIIIKRSDKGDKSYTGNKTEHSSYAPGRSCFDCKHCDCSRAKGERIYCTWDSEHYFPGAGTDCRDFSMRS